MTGVQTCALPIYQNPELEKPRKIQLDLVEHFHWEIMKNRRRRGFSHKQLADALGESEVALQMIEKAKLPENAEILIKKLEQFFQFRLLKVIGIEKKMGGMPTSPVLLDSSGNELISIPEEKFEIIPKIVPVKGVEGEDKILTSAQRLLEKRGRMPPKEEVEEEFTIESILAKNIKEMPREEPHVRPAEKIKEKLVGEVDIKKIDRQEIKISELRELHRRRIEVSKQEKIEEQKRIEERQRLIYVRKEELRQLKEKESKELDNILGGVELLGKSSDRDLGDETGVKEFDDELI